MDPAYISAVAALSGSAIGALASVATNWVTQATQLRATQRTQDRTHRETLYSEFIREASRLFVDAYEHELEDPAKLVSLYSIVSTIRLFGGPGPLREAEKVMSQIGATYFAPNKELRLFAEMAPGGELDPLFAFSAACREELQLDGLGRPRRPFR